MIVSRLLWKSWNNKKQYFKRKAPMQKLIYGNLELNDKIYPFFLQERTIHIVQQVFQFYEDFSSMSKIELLRGVTYDNRDILFLNCRFSTNPFFTTISVQGYIISKSNLGQSCDFIFDHLSFYSDALNTFYPIQKAAKTQIGNKDSGPSGWDGRMTIEIKPFCETDTTFQFRDAECTFSIARFRDWKNDTSSIGDLNTSLMMSFPELKMPETVCQYYLNVLDFLSFVNYSKNITFRKIILGRKHGGKHHEIAQATIFTNAAAYDRDSNSSITIEDIPKDKFAVIFSRVATLREYDGRFSLYFPNSAEDSRYIDHSRWLMTALCFEGLFQYTYPEFKVQLNEDFRYVKNGILEAIDGYKKSADLSSRKRQKYFDDCQKHIERYEGVLEEKFNYVFKTYNIELSDIISSIEKTLGISDIRNWGSIYQAFRNKLAHGDIEPIGNNEIAIYRLLCPMIYILLLDSASLGKEELRQILKKLFS